MRRALLLLFAAPSALACCITYAPHATDFFAYTNAVFYGRANNAGEFFIIESVVSGEMNSDHLDYGPLSQCSRVEDDKLYLIVRFCEREKPCAHRWVAESETPRMIEFLKRAHRETHETVIAATLKWLRGETSLDAFRDWIETTAITPRGEDDDEFLLEFLAQVRSVLWDLNEIASRDSSLADLLRQTELPAFARALSSFPPGTQKEFDARVDENAEDPKWRADYEEDVLDALKSAVASPAWTKALEEHAPPGA